MKTQRYAAIAAGYTNTALLVVALFCRDAASTVDGDCSLASCVDDMSFIQVPVVNRSEYQRSALASAAKPQHAIVDRAHSLNFSDSSWANTVRGKGPYVRHWRWGPTQTAKHHRGLEHTKSREWALFAFGLLVFSAIQQNMPTSQSPVSGLAFWLWMGTAFAMCVFALLGFEKGEEWLTGYVLELCFSLDNCFVSLIVANELHLPRNHARKAFSVLVYSQISFEVLFFFGLAERISSCNAFPYALGVWLLYNGYMAVAVDHGVEHDEVANVEDTYVARAVKRILGDRFSPRYEPGENSPMIVSKEGKQSLTMLPVAVFVLMCVNFALEIDVVLLKIEMFNSQILAFTSSVVATFALPEIFLMVEDLFERYRFLTQGISLILVLEGIALILHKFIIVSATEQILAIIFVMLWCVLLSEAFPANRLESPKGDTPRRRLTT